MKNKILLALTLIFVGIPAFSKSNFSYVAVNDSQNLVGYHAQNVNYNVPLSDVYTFDDSQPLYQLQANSNAPTGVSSAQNVLIASNTPSNTVNNISTRGNVDYITFPSKNNFNFSKAAGIVLGMAAECARDPYVVELDGNKYIMILDNFDGIYNENDIIGIGDSKNKVFASLKKLNVDNDKTKLTSKELKDRGVRFVKIDKDGRLAARDYTQDLPIDSIIYIDIKNLIKIKNAKNTGIFGEFDILMKEKNASSKIVKGQVTYELQKDLVKLF